MGKCSKKPKLEGKKPKFTCKKCGQKAIKKDHVCKPVKGK
jgi:predicted RNA-binding Zn-ribbon protein involved in translation (DUF1610 family)